MGTKAPRGDRGRRERQGGTWGYYGPCPRSGRHHYFHKLFDNVFPNPGRWSKEELLAQIRRYSSRIIAEAELVGTKPATAAPAHPGAGTATSTSF
jgi:phosphatidylethanolamine-binding protein (PEBP) family uncharacterized protein